MLQDFLKIWIFSYLPSNVTGSSEIGRKSVQPTKDLFTFFTLSGHYLVFCWPCSLNGIMLIPDVVAFVILLH